MHSAISLLVSRLTAGKAGAWLSPGPLVWWHTLVLVRSPVLVLVHILVEILVLGKILIRILVIVLVLIEILVRILIVVLIEILV